MKARLLILAMLLCGGVRLVATPEAPAKSLGIYGTQGAAISVLAELANAIVADDGRVMEDPGGGRLLIITTPEKHALLRAALDQSTASIRNVQLNITFTESLRKRETGASLGGTFESSPTGSRLTLQPGIQYQRTNTDTDTAQMLVATSGTTASLRVGEVIPYLEWTVEDSPWNARTRIGTRWLDVGAFLTFTPTIQPDGERIHVRLTPEVRGRTAEGEPVSHRFTTLQTDVVARNGQTIEIANTEQANSLFERFLIGGSSTRQKKSLVIAITPTILP